MCPETERELLVVCPGDVPDQAESSDGPRSNNLEQRLPNSRVTSCFLCLSNHSTGWRAAEDRG